MTKETIYDERIHPLMSQIFEICKHNGIAMLCTFAIPTPEDEDLQCTSILPDENDRNPDHHLTALRALRGAPPAAIAMTITPAAKPI